MCTSSGKRVHKEMQSYRQQVHLVERLHVQRILPLTSSDLIHLKGWVCKTQRSGNLVSELPIKLEVSRKNTYDIAIIDGHVVTFGNELHIRCVAKLLIEMTNITEWAKVWWSEATSIILLCFFLSFTFSLFHTLKHAL